MDIQPDRCVCERGERRVSLAMVVGPGQGWAGECGLKGGRIKNRDRRADGRDAQSEGNKVGARPGGRG